VKSADQYLQSIRDGRHVYLRGSRIRDVTVGEAFGPAVRRVARGYERYFRDEPEAWHPMYEVPSSPDMLRERLHLVEDNDVTTATSAAVLTLVTACSRSEVIEDRYGDQIRAYMDWVRREDLRVAELITDAKGDRSLPPSKQDDPDLYVRVVDRTESGIVVRGAKFHVSAAPVVHEFVTMPTKRMKVGEEEYATAFAVPANADGVRIIGSAQSPTEEDARHFPASANLAMPEAMIVFDDVFVPYERVFLDGEVAESALFAHSLGLWERLSGLVDIAHRADVLVGLAQLVAEANGVAGITHIKEKIADIIIYSTMIRAGIEASINAAEELPGGICTPSELYTNALKYYAAANYHIVLRNVQDVAGGSVVTAPTIGDLEHSEIGDYVAKYLRTSDDIDARYRLSLFHLIRDLTADAHGGKYMVGYLVGGGGLMAQQLVTRKHFDMERAKRAAILEGELAARSNS
jgi:4-hydroxybutyryl-CoA dehydratase / vinylacetyl-CoA-Delta-isomerase